MPEIVVRPYEPRDQEQTWHVRAMTYNSGRPIPIEQQVYKTSRPFVAELDGRIVGTYVVMDMTCTRAAQAAWKTGGIAGVAVLPEARHTGVGNAMMRWALRNLREEGYVLASLYGFRESYYRKFGYEVCGMRYKITCPNARLPRSKPDLDVQRVPFAGLDRIKGCYEGFATRRGGVNLRSDMHWSRIITDDLVRTIYAAGDPVEAYAILEHDVDFWQEQTVAEFVWTSARGYESILSTLAAIGINKTSLTWHEPSDSLFLQRHVDQGVRIESEKPTMFRILNLPSAVEQLGSVGEGSFTMAVHDPELPENQGPWQIRYSGGKSEISSCAFAELAMDPRNLVQALLG